MAKYVLLSEFRNWYAPTLSISVMFPTRRSPHQTRATITSADLDLESRRITLLIPGLYVLDINLELPDAAIGQASLGVETDLRGAENVLTLKRARDLDVDRARAEWRVNEGCLVIVA